MSQAHNLARKLDQRACQKVDIQEGLVREIDKKKKKITGQTEWKDILGQGMNK